MQFLVKLCISEAHIFVEFAVKDDVERNLPTILEVNNVNSSMTN
jgi:hypothetical protein